MSVKACNYNHCFYLPEEIISLLFSERPPSKLQTLCLTALYSMDAQELLADYREHLPRYLLLEWEHCRGVLAELEEMGLLSIGETEEIALAHRPAGYRQGKSVVDLFAEAAGTTAEEFLADTEPQRLKTSPCRKRG